MKSFMTTLNI
nr:unnamed protein product [Callosobruchus analis]